MVSCIQSVELWLCRICHSFKDLFQRNLMMLIDKHNHRHNVILTQGSIFSFRKWSGISSLSFKRSFVCLPFLSQWQNCCGSIPILKFPCFQQYPQLSVPYFKESSSFQGGKYMSPYASFYVFLYSNSIFFRSYALKFNYFCYLCRSNCRLSYRRI
jgi:hypothetical protein